MITNRNIESVELFEEALDEVVTSARESGVDDADLASVLRAHATALSEPDDSDSDSDDSDSEPSS